MDDYVEPNPSESKKGRKAALPGSTSLTPPDSGNGATTTGNGAYGDNVVSMPIPDPGDDAPSAYTSAPNFAGRQGIKRKTSILLKKPKNYCRSLFSMAARQGLITLIDIARADAMDKDLNLIMPEIASDDDLMHDVEGAFEALAIPFIDRYLLNPGLRHHLTTL